MSARPLSTSLSVPPRALLAGGAIVTLAFVLRVPYLSWPITTDEGGYALAVYWLRRGVTLYSDELWFDRPQGIFVMYEIGMTLLGASVEAIRAWGAVWFGVLALGTWLLARDFLRPRGAFIAGLLAALAPASPWVEGFTANAEVFMTALAVFSAWLLWRRHIAWAGLAAGLAIMLKPSGATAVVLAAFWLYRERAALGDWAAFVLAASVPLGVGLVHGWATAGIWPYFYATVWFRIENPVTDQAMHFAFGLLNTFTVTAPLLFASWLALDALAPRQRMFWWAWLATSFAGVAMGGNWSPHYFVQLLPPLCLGAAAFVDRATSAPTNRVRFIGAALVVGFVAWPIAQYAALGPVEGISTLYRRPGFLVQRDIAEYVKQRTTPADRIYVAFSEPGLSYYTERMSVVPWLYPQQIADLDGAYEAVLEAARQAEPAYIVFVDNGPGYLEAFPPLREAMGDRYELEREYPNAYVYRRIP